VRQFQFDNQLFAIFALNRITDASLIYVRAFSKSESHSTLSDINRPITALYGFSARPRFKYYAERNVM